MSEFSEVSRLLAAAERLLREARSTVMSNPASTFAHIDAAIETIHSTKGFLL